MSLLTYINGTRLEMKNVKWPSRHQVITFTIMTIIVSVLVAYYLGLFDFIFTKLLNLLIS